MSERFGDPGVAAAITSVHRLHWARLLGLLAVQWRDLDLAEECLADAFETAVRQWPLSGVPENPPAWLLIVARRRAIDVRRRASTLAAKLPELTPSTISGAEQTMDDSLQLMFICAHPGLSSADQLALTLRCVSGLAVPDVARLLLTSEATMAARLTRAKKRAALTKQAFHLPDGTEIASRMTAVLHVLYTLFTAGYAPATGSGVTDNALLDEAIRLTRLLIVLRSSDAQPRALLALMLIQNSRRDARTDACGMPILLPDQDRDRWRQQDLVEAQKLLSGMLSTAPEPYLLQALIAWESSSSLPDWQLILHYFDLLNSIAPSPIVLLNRAVVLAEIEGPEAALQEIDPLAKPLASHMMYYAIRADLYRRESSQDSSKVRFALNDYRKALSLSRNTANTRFLEARIAYLLTDPPS